MKKIKFALVVLASVVLSACGGGGGAAAPTTVSSTPIDLCAVESKNYGDVAIPSGYLGTYTIPTAAGRLANGVVRTADLADWDYWWSRPASVLCTDKIAYLKNVNRETIRRLAAIGVDRIYISNIGSWDNIENSIWHIPEENYSIPKIIQEYIVNEAHSRGVKVFLTWQHTNCDGSHGCSGYDPESMSESQFTTLLNSWRQHILEQAAYAKSIGIDGINVGIDNFTPNSIKNGGQFRNQYTDAISKLAQELKLTFPGVLYFGGQNDDVYTEIIDAVDEFLYRIYAGSAAGTYGPGNPLSISNIKSRMDQGFYWDVWRGGVDFANAGKINKPVIFKIYAQSNEYFYNGGWIEDNYCSEPCSLQRGAISNFSLQAIAYEAALQFINEQRYVTVGGAGTYGYAFFDSLTETVMQNGLPAIPINGMSTFPNISNSIRNKPAEGIVRDWFRRQ